jgi:hypothetical protein
MNADLIAKIAMTVLITILVIVVGILPFTKFYDDDKENES